MNEITKQLSKVWPDASKPGDRYWKASDPKPQPKPKCIRADMDCFYCTSRECPASPLFVKV